MKHTLIILILLTASIQTFAQSPRIKLNQITKDSVTGSVLISSPTDSGMVYSRDLFISYGADTVLILGGDTLAATSSIISSVLSDGVTITGDGTTGSELTADTSVLATLRALSDSLANYVYTTELSDSTSNIRTDIPLIISDSLLNYVSRTELSDSLALVISSVTADNVTITGDGTVGSPLTVDTSTVIATKQDLDLYYLDSNPDGYTSNTGTVTSVGATAGTGISVSGSPITTSGTLTITNTAPDQTVSIAGGGINAVTGTYPSFTVTGTEVDGSVTNEIQDISTTGAAGNISISSGSTLNLNVDDADASASNELQTLSYNSSTNEITLSDGGGTEDLSNLDLVDSTRINATGDTAYYYQNGVLIGTGPIAGGGGTTYNNITEGNDTVYISDHLDVDTSTLFVDANNNRVGMGLNEPRFNLEIKGTGSDLTRFFVGGNECQGTTPDGCITDFYINRADSRGFAMQILSDSVTNSIFNVESNVSGANQMRLRTDDGLAGINFIHGSSTGPIRFIQNTTPRLIINAGGEVLIGYESSQDNGAYKLQVNSQIFATSSTIATSDIKYKTNILDLENGLDLVMRLKPKTYDFRQNPIHNFSSETQVGFIAQEVQEVFSNKNYLNSIIYQNKGYLGMAYEKIIPITVKAIQEQQAIIESQANEIEQLKTLITELSNRLQILENN